MARKTLICSVLALSACVLLTGCMPHMTVEQMKAKMPQRPAELDRMDAFVGKWHSEGEARFSMLDEPLKFSGTSEMAWGDDSKWYMVGQGTMIMDDFEPSQMLEAWTYDSHDKKYRSTFVDSMGMSGTGESTYDEETNTWHMKGEAHGPWGKSWMKGSMQWTGPDTMEWHMTEYQGLMKIMEMTGTAKKMK